MEEEEETGRDCDIEKLEDKKQSQVIESGPCTTGLEDSDKDMEMTRKLFPGLQGGLEIKENSQVIVNGSCPTGLKDKDKDSEGRDEKADERQETIKELKKTNRHTI